MQTSYALVWLMALATAAWFSMVARRAKTSWILWGIGGGLLGVFITTVVFGLTEAACIPLSIHEAAVFQFRAVLTSVLIILLSGGALTWSFYRRK